MPRPEIKTNRMGNYKIPKIPVRKAQPKRRRVKSKDPIWDTPTEIFDVNDVHLFSGTPREWLRARPEIMAQREG